MRWEEWGVPDGVPALYLHGGPACRRRPVSLATNDTAHLIADIEALRQHLDIDAWVLNGVSWGSTLALAYAIEHPTRVLGIVLVAVTTTSRAEVDWITEGVGAVFPEAWDRFAAPVEDVVRRCVPTARSA